MLKILAVVFLFVVTNLTAQKRPFKFGDVDQEDMDKTACSFYPEAKSMVLAEFGELTFEFRNDKGWSYNLRYANRIKVFDITEANQGNIKIRLYEPKSGGSKESISGFKAFTHNLVNGKIEKEKVNSGDLFETRIDDYWVELSIALPNIQNGSVIEYTYNKTSDYISNLTTWEFQKEIPVAHSEFRYTIPEFFNFQTSQLGYISTADWEEKRVSENFEYVYTTPPGALGKIERRVIDLESSSTWTKVIMTDVIPLSNEPYMNNPSDIPARVEYQLISIQYPNMAVEYIAGDYAKFNKELIEHSNFGGRLEKGEYIQKQMGMLTGSTNMEKAIQIYNHLVNHLSWNEVNSYFSEKSSKAVYMDAKGDVADINLSLIAALRSYGIQAHPVLLSTRGHGSVHPVYPDYKDFNYVIAAIMDGEKIYLADAATRLPFSELPMKCRNGQGWLVNNPHGNWIDLKKGSQYKVSTMLISSIEDGNLVTHVKQANSGYAARKILNKKHRMSLQEYAQDLETNFTEGQIKNLELPDDENSKKVKVNYDLVRQMEMENVMYIQPILLGSLLENPFQQEQRFSTIDFPYEQLYNCISKLQVPDGYTVELPTQISLKLPENQGSFRYTVSQTGNEVSIVSKVTMKNTVFTVVDYPSLKQFYQMVVDKNQEPIVLKK